jgi:AmmeMemoRadiSam system protein B
MKVRRASAWGFHPFDRDGELSEVKNCFVSKHGVGEMPEINKNGERRILGAVVPHAGISISGPTASYTYHSLAKDGAPSIFIIFGVSHRGYPGFSTMFEGVWRMPLGDVEVDSELAKAVVKNSEFVDINPSAHDEEHSIEVQLPFLQFIYDGNFKIVPILVGFGDYEMCENVGNAAAKAVKETGRDAVILGSTDFTHYGFYYGYAPVGMRPFENTLNWMRNTDRSLIDAILSLDGEKLVRMVREKGYTMCGSLPVATMLAAVKELGAKEAKLLKYGTSYDVTGSEDLIVGYGSIIVLK